MPASTPDSVARGYAHAIVEVARAEGVLDRVEEELFRFARAVQDNAALRDRLGDASLDVSTRLQIVGDLLTRAHPQTVAAVNYVLQAGRARFLTPIAEAVGEVAASDREQVVAQVRSAVPLADDQRERLAAALGKSSGKSVSLKVVVDPSVVGGLVVTMGDTVIDGSVASRLAAVRASFVSG
jgi:F-type H+-transporting ATPase subunit delta